MTLRHAGFPAAPLRIFALGFLLCGVFPGCESSLLEQPGGFLPLDPGTLFVGSSGAGASRQSGESRAFASEDQSLPAAARGQIIKRQALETADREAPKKPAPPPAAQASQKPAAGLVSGAVFGTGRLLHSRPLSGVYSKEYYLIRGRLLSAGGGQAEGCSRLEGQPGGCSCLSGQPGGCSWLRLYSHFTGFHLEDGIQIDFLREGEALKIQASSPGYPKRIIYKDEAYFLQTSEIDLRLSVQNGSYGQARVQIWSHYINRSGFLKAKAKGLGGENLLAGTFAKGLAFYSFGRGARWGIRLNRAQLIRAARISPRKFPDGRGLEAIWSLE